MDRGARQATVPGVTEVDMPERLTVSHFFVSTCLHVTHC